MGRKESNQTKNKTCKNKEVLFKIEGARVITTFLPLEVYGNFPRHSRAANSAVPGPILRNFETIHDFMVFLIICKNEEDPINNEGARVVTTILTVNGIRPKFNPFQAFMIVLVTCKNEEDPSKNEGTRVVTTFLPLLWGFFQTLNGS